MNRYAFEVERPDEENRKEYRIAGDGLTAEEAVERAYDDLPAGSRIVRLLRGDFPEGLDVSPPGGASSDASSEPEPEPEPELEDESDDDAGEDEDEDEE